MPGDSLSESKFKNYLTRFEKGELRAFNKKLDDLTAGQDYTETELELHFDIRWEELKQRLVRTGRFARVKESGLIRFLGPQEPGPTQTENQEGDTLENRGLQLLVLLTSLFPEGSFKVFEYEKSEQIQQFAMKVKEDKRILLWHLIRSGDLKLPEGTKGIISKHTKLTIRPASNENSA